MKASASGALGSSARAWSWVFTESKNPSLASQGWICNFMCG